MKVKKQILIFLLFANFYAYAQVDWCGSKVDDSFLNGVTSTANQNVTMSYFDDQPSLVLRVHFYDINEDDGSNPHPLTETTALNAVAELNKNFNSFKIFFKFDGIDSFNSSEFFEIELNEDQNIDEHSEFNSFLNDNNHYTAGAVNIYSIDNIIGAAAYYSGGTGNGVFTVIACEFDLIDDPETPYVLIHEVGHNFHLAHTFHCRELADESILCENVTREPFLVDGTTPNPDYNADTEGDKIIDTYATPQSYNRTDCVYDDNLLDSTGTPYSNHPPQAKNFMSYAHGCQQEFTAGQIAEMRWYIELIDGLPITAIENHDVSILYEPYKGEYFLAGPLPVDEGGHLNPPKFQYGFDYVFYDTSQADIYNQPSDYDNTSFWYGQVVQSYDIDYNIPIEHTNHTAFKILQVDTNYPRMCYNNYNRAPSGGTIIKFNDDVLNTNVTVTAQDSLQINNTNFFQDLEPGLYNIQKSYNDGTSEENLILKENN